MRFFNILLISMEFNLSRQFAEQQSNQDNLKQFRDKFHFPVDDRGNEIIYFTGNSLGLQPKITKSYIQQELDDWKKYGVEGHFHAKNPWMPYHELLTDKLAAVVGAKPVEVVAMNSLTVNLHLMMVSFYRPTKQKYKIMIEGGAFPSDIYAVKSQLNYHGFDENKDLIELLPREGEHTLRTEDIINKIDKHSNELALVMLAGVNYYTGQAFDMKTISEECRKRDIICGFDLAHGAGNLDLQLHDWEPDFAVWCSYKYLNSGPGGIACAFVHEKHKNFDGPRFNGWWGADKASRFLMGPDFHPIEGVEAWQMSNPPIFQLASLNASLELFKEAGYMKPLRDKSDKMTSYLEYLVKSLGEDKIEIITPENISDRGAQLSIRVKNADKKMFDDLLDLGVSADWREPDVIRVAPAPLYNNFLDCFNFYEKLKSLIK